MATRAAGTPPTDAISPDEALAEVAAGAGARDHGSPRFPEDAMTTLERAGLLAATVPLDAPAPSHAEEWALLRRIARADGSVGRIADGHFNAVERVAALAPEPLRTHELRAVVAGVRRMGVWGADPTPAEGTPARLVGKTGEQSLAGVKVFCSGAGGIDRALVTVHGASLQPVLVLVDVTAGTTVDPTWFRGSGMRTSESHRVEFDGAPVLAVLGEPGEIVREPWFSRDAIRTAACWAGIADRAADAVLETLAARPAVGDLDALAAGRVIGAQATIDGWLEVAGQAAADPARDLRTMSVNLRSAIAAACREIVGAGSVAAGSRALSGPGDLDRCRRDLELFLMQHRLEPMVARVGRAELERRR